MLRRLLGSALVLALLAVVVTAADAITVSPVSVAADYAPAASTHQPAALAPRSPLTQSIIYMPFASQSGATATGAIIIDHTNTDITKIPDAWLAQAKLLTIHYAHTSHGSQILSGLTWLEGQNSKYNFDVQTGGAPALPLDASALRIYDGNNLGDNTYITPDLYWDGDSGKNNTRSVANTGLFRYSMWAWCGQQSSNDTATVQRYLDTLNQFEQQYPSMRFVYFTGHTDGGSATLAQNNEMVRQYVRAHGKVLFDFADIETYDPSGGGPYNNNGDGTCSWCKSYCDSHPGFCTSLPSDCAHTDSPTEARLFCKLKGQAYWWLMARLAGWSGAP